MSPPPRVDRSSDALRSDCLGKAFALVAMDREVRREGELCCGVL
jgi:hypothetical protein